MIRIGCIVEGHGEVGAARVLVRRIASEFHGEFELEIGEPFRMRRGEMIAPGGIERAVQQMGNLLAPDARLLVLLDADDDCPRDLASKLLDRARAERTDLRIGLVVAVREYESWFLASLSSLRGVCSLAPDAQDHPSPETVRDAKGLLGESMTERYSPPIHQPRLTARMNLTLARRAASFDKLCREMERLLAP